MKTKLCGKNEECFERGSQWGHMEGCMCKHLGEDCRGGICLLDAEPIEYYATQAEYEKLIKEIQP